MADKCLGDNHVWTKPRAALKNPDDYIYWQPKVGKVCQCGSKEWTHGDKVMWDRHVKRDLEEGSRPVGSSDV